MYENYREPLLSRREFVMRELRHIIIVASLFAVWVAIGVIGYAGLGHLSPIDAFLNAAMIAGGMGPVDVLTNDEAKLFAGMYAIISGIIILAGAGIVLAPAVHRFLHKLHLDDYGEDRDDDTHSAS